MMGSFFKRAVICCIMVCLIGCAPKISEKDRTRISQGARPAKRTTTYTEGLDALSRVINKGIGASTYFQVQPIANKTGTAKLPEEATDIVTNSVNLMAGRYLKVVPYEKAENVSVNTTLHKDQYNPQLPNVVVTGAITEFDQDITEKSSGTNLEGYIPAQIEGEQVDTDLMAEFSSAESVSRIAIELRLMNYKTRVIYPKMHVSNTILVFELARQRNLGFMIYGSGLSRTGNVSIKQGLHQAVRNLIDYSVLQLFGKYYSIPYWRTLGATTPDSGMEWLADWRYMFLTKPQSQQIGQIQVWLSRYPLEPVYIDGVMMNNIPQQEYGKFGKVTQAFTLQFLYQYAPRSALVNRVERSNFPQNREVLGDLFVELLQNIPFS